MRLLWPWAFLGLIILPALYVLQRHAERRRTAYSVAPATSDLLRCIPAARGRRRGLYWFAGAVGAVVLTMSRPEVALPVRREIGAVVLVLDTSGSMSAADIAPSRMHAVIEAARALLDALPQTLRVGLVQFDDRAQIRAPVGTDPAAIRGAMPAVNPAGATNLAAAITTAVDAVVEYRREVGLRVPGRIVLLSDGEATAGPHPREAWPAAVAAGIPIDTIGLRVSAEGEATLREIATSTGGEHMTVNSREALTTAFWRVRGLAVWEWRRTEVSAIGSLISAALTVVLIAMRAGRIYG